MIPSAFVTAWRKYAPWIENSQVEQDLIIERSLVEIFNDPFLKEHLSFRGGTAMHKFFMKPQPRYSEDIDLVQIRPEPIKETIKHIQNRLSFFEKAETKQKANNNTLIFRYTSESGLPLKLKVEINCREHYTLFGYTDIKINVNNTWFTGEANIRTYKLEELLGTKLRALYQRKKGRDLFDLWFALKNQIPDCGEIIQSWKFYMDQEGHSVTGKEFIKNVEDKLSDSDFIGDTNGILRPDISYNPIEAYPLVHSKLLTLI
jgi:predicted nucleotidyltransferase component of viral defense system